MLLEFLYEISLIYFVYRIITIPSVSSVLRKLAQNSISSTNGELILDNDAFKSIKSIIGYDELTPVVDYFKTKLPDEDVNIIVSNPCFSLHNIEAVNEIFKRHGGIVRVHIPRIASSSGLLIALCADEVYASEFGFFSSISSNIEIWSISIPTKYFKELSELNFYNKFIPRTILNEAKSIENRIKKLVIQSYICSSPTEFLEECAGVFERKMTFSDLKTFCNIKPLSVN